MAAVQFQVGADIQANLATCLHWLDEASQCGAELVVLPEFCNHLSWYQDKQHCFEVSVRLDGPFLAAIADKARTHQMHVVVNCTVQREDASATGSSLLYDPDGRLLADNTKQIYIGHENDFLREADKEGAVVATKLGRLGLYACMDGVINETPRCLALRGAQIMLNSLNSFASDEASLHVPVRAAENKVFVVAANKVGPLVPEDMLEAISHATQIPRVFLCGAGESQVVGPDGHPIVKASRKRAEIVWADIEVGRADDKRRPDGTHIMQSRRAELYAPITSDPKAQATAVFSSPAEVAAAVVQLGENAAEREVVGAVSEAVDAGARLICLPPMVGDLRQRKAEFEAGERLVEEVAQVCGQAIVGTALVRAHDDGFRYCAVLITTRGLVHEQPQVHRSTRYAFSVPADGFSSYDSDYGRIAVVPSDDSIYPETFRLLALSGVEVAMVPLAPLEAWELEIGLLERSAENRINLLVAASDDSLGAGFITALPTDFTIMTEWNERTFDGILSQPERQHCHAGGTVSLGAVRPANAANKVVSKNTDLLRGRPWRLAGAISRTD